MIDGEGAVDTCGYVDEDGANVLQLCRGTLAAR
jgi:hypothetical protein